MANLVFVQGNRVMTDSSTVARVFGKNHAAVLRDVRHILETVDHEWGITNFVETPYVHPQNGQTYNQYIMTEDGFTLLVMGYTGTEAMRFKLNYIQAFRALEAQVHRGTPAPLTRLQLIELARDAELARLALEEQNAELSAKLDEQAPKVSLYDVAMQAVNAQPIGTIAKVLNIGPNKLFAWLREEGILMSHGARYNLPKAEYMDRGYFEVREYTITHFTTGIENKAQPLVTPKGLAWIQQRWDAAHAVQEVR